MVDLRRELASIIEDYGSDYLLIKVEDRIKCSCVRELHGAPNPKCPICLGLGYLNKAVRVRGRSTFASIPETLPRMMNTATPGNIAVPSKQFYLNHKAEPFRKDLIVVCEWDGSKPVFDKYTEIFEINEVDPNRGDQGRIEYFIASAKGDPVNANIKLSNIKSNSENDFYITVGEM